MPNENNKKLFLESLQQKNLDTKFITKQLEEGGSWALSMLELFTLRRANSALTLELKQARKTIITGRYIETHERYGTA